jgi:hypothetical protein
MKIHRAKKVKGLSFIVIGFGDRNLLKINGIYKKKYSQSGRVSARAKSAAALVPG